jgi:catechol 2,3-dioxygenase-like lactoylglutathione lyase family enzyme
MTESTNTSWATNLFAVTIFAEDLAAMREFYERVFELPCVFGGDTSAIYKFGDTMINILQIDNASELIEPASVAGPDAGARSMFTVNVTNVDAVHARLVAKGVEFLNGPIDRPWGPRTVAIADPAGHMWEIAQH